jgi:hypothetical protein
MLFVGCSNSKVESSEKLWVSAIEFRENDDLRSSITNFKSIIKNYPKSEFSVKSQFQIADIYLNDVKNYWPLVYILSSGKIKEAYIGETTDAQARMTSHLKHINKSKLSAVHLITSKKFNHWRI